MLGSKCRGGDLSRADGVWGVGARRRQGGAVMFLAGETLLTFTRRPLHRRHHQRSPFTGEGGASTEGGEPAGSSLSRRDVTKAVGKCGVGKSRSALCAQTKTPPTRKHTHHTALLNDDGDLSGGDSDAQGAEEPLADAGDRNTDTHNTPRIVCEVFLKGSGEALKEPSACAGIGDGVDDEDVERALALG
jgi:hypothetical protein